MCHFGNVITRTVAGTTTEEVLSILEDVVMSLCRLDQSVGRV